MNEPSVRVHVILAREASVGVIFRRGPSKYVLLILWETDSDSFYAGQWLKGRIYEHRCDLSPSGQRLICFAAKYGTPLDSWTAVSRPPFLKAIALWPKGDGWGGGGLFSTERAIQLNHRQNEMNLEEGFNLPKGVTVKPLGEHAGRGEDDPIAHTRLLRDGWTITQGGTAIEHDLGDPVRIEYDPPRIYSKPSPDGRYDLRRLTRGLNERDGPWYVTEHTIADRQTGIQTSLGRSDWADWCHSGDLLFARDGQLFRLQCDEKAGLSPVDSARIILDLREMAFEEVTAPEAAARWGGELPRSALEARRLTTVRP